MSVEQKWSKFILILSDISKIWKSRKNQNLSGVFSSWLDILNVFFLHACARRLLVTMLRRSKVSHNSRRNAKPLVLSSVHGYARSSTRSGALSPTFDPPPYLGIFPEFSPVEYAVSCRSKVGEQDCKFLRNIRFRNLHPAFPEKHNESRPII